MHRPRTYLARQFSALSERNFRVFFIGQSLSLIGTWMQSVGFAWLTLELTDSEVAVGIVTALQFLPMMLFALVGGVLADRWPRRKTLIILQSAALTQAVILSVLVVTDSAVLWHVYVLAFVAGLLSAIERPMRQSFFSEMAGREHLANAVALHSMILNGSRVIGPAIAGVLIAWAGVEWTFILNAVSYAAVLLGYALIRTRELHPQKVKAQPGSVLSQIAEGLRYAAKTPSFAFIFLLIGVIGTLGYNFNVTIPLIARFVLDSSPQEFGLLTAALGLGSLGAALWLAAAGARTQTFLIGAALAFSVLFLILAISQWFWLTAVGLFLVGFAGISLMTGANTTLQLEAPEEMRGRMISIYMFLMAGSTPIGGFLTGLLSSLWGVRTALAIEAIGCFAGVALAVGYLKLRARSLERVAVDPAVAGQ